MPRPLQHLAILTLLALAAGLAGCSSLLSKPGHRLTRLDDGKTFAGWEGDTTKTWRVENGAFVAGSLLQTVPNNEFLATTRQYTNFILTLQVKLTGTEGFVNGGIQVRSQRIDQPAYEMRGYQADVGEGWWGSLYDESRRNKVLVKADPAVIAKVLKKNAWNDYEVRCEGKRIRLYLNGTQTVDYTEPDDSIPQFGKIAVQVHGGGKAVAAYREIWIRELP